MTISAMTWLAPCCSTVGCLLAVAPILEKALFIAALFVNAALLGRSAAVNVGAATTRAIAVMAVGASRGPGPPLWHCPN